MTSKEDILRMAREAGFSEWAVGLSEMPLHLERFAALVTFAEREACAKVCDDHGEWTPRMIGSTIRARGQA